MTNTVFLSEHRLLCAVTREGQWSLESATWMAIVPVAVFAGMSAGDVGRVQHHTERNTTIQRVGQYHARLASVELQRPHVQRMHHKMNVFL